MEDLKKCARCHNLKPFIDFNKCKRGTYGLHNHCRLCQKEVKRAWYKIHRVSELQKSKVAAQTEKAKEYRKKRWMELKNILGPKANERRRQEPAKIKARIQRAKWLEIPHNKIAQNLRGRIRHALKSLSKIASTEILTGCSFEELKKHLEKNFLPGMTWENYGKWHVDHIIPCASFDFSNPAEQLKCFHYSNLRPLWAGDNYSKGSKIIVQS